MCKMEMFGPIDYEKLLFKRKELIILYYRYESINRKGIQRRLCRVICKRRM